LNPEREWNFVRWDSMAQAFGCTKAELLALPLQQIIFSLMLYYGPEEIFGTSYWEGFAISAK